MNDSIRFAAWLLLIVFVVAFPAGVFAQGVEVNKSLYDKAEYMVPMRDGVKLHTQVFTPKDKSQKYPIMIYRTPYSIGSYGPDTYRNVLGPNEMYAKEGFIFAYQDVRGKFKSEGEEFIVMKPHKKNKKGVKDTDESSDTYDMIEWLLKNIPNNNGRAGQWGISYGGFQTSMGMIEAHPALKASSPQASPSDMWIGDDFHHNGAFRYQYTFGWLSRNAATRTTGPSEAPAPPFTYGTPDGYRFFLELGSASAADKKYFQGRVPTWNEYMDHPDYDSYWKNQNVLNYLDKINHNILNVAGWFDAEDFYGPMSIYYTIEKKNKPNKSILIVGPWHHGGWSRVDGDTLGHIRFGAKTGVYFREKIEFPFFVSLLKDKGDPKLPEAHVFETGTNQWRSYDQWPPKGVEVKNLYFQANGKLSFTAPTGSGAFDSFESDPNKPVPFSAETRTSNGHLWMVEDQRFAASRPDVLVYESDVLTENVTIAGPIIASLQVSTTGTDADWIVKLIDVYPGDAPDNTPNPAGIRMGHFQMLLGAEVFRSRYRNSFEKPEAMVPNQVTKIEYDLRDKFHTFQKGHRIMVQVQSSWFPVIDRNPQKFVNIYRAVESDYQKATHKVYRSAGQSSHLKLGIFKP